MNPSVSDSDLGEKCGLDGYPYFGDVAIHLDYLLQVLADRKLRLPELLRRLITTAWRSNGLAQDRAFYMLYKLRCNPLSLPPYLLRMRSIIHPRPA